MAKSLNFSSLKLFMTCGLKMITPQINIQKLATVCAMKPASNVLKNAPLVNQTLPMKYIECAMKYPKITSPNPFTNGLKTANELWKNATSIKLLMIEKTTKLMILRMI